MNKYTYPRLPHAFHWSAQELADAVPLRLHQLLDFDGLQSRSAANGDRDGKTRTPSYLPRTALPSTFRIS